MSYLMQSKGLSNSSFSCKPWIGVIHDLAPPLHDAYRGL